MKREDVDTYIEKIKLQLHTGHASLMVGSGFSRNAEIRSSLAHLPPTWNELKDAFANSLYGKTREEYREKKCASKNVLQLAREYEELFDRSGLNQFLGEQIQDSDIYPGKLHESLLKLPWRDVFTTNYDTLLERAAESIVDSNYNVVRCCADLAFSKSPRIIKLHGSLESAAFHLIVTEEDYRTYPIKYAPFVNTVQQAITETTLCLIGFSGTDPNFLKWIGWVRDNLKESMPSVYLIDRLDLSNSEYKVLIKNKINPVDLSVFEGKGYKDLLESFIKKVKTYSPVEWDLSSRDNISKLIITPFQTKDENQQRADKIIRIWKEQRENYPNWPIVPHQYRQSLLSLTEYWTEMPKWCVEFSIPQPQDIQWLYEYNWRIEHCLMRIPSDNIGYYENILKSYNPFGLKEDSFFNEKVYSAKNKKWENKLSLHKIWIQLMFAVMRWKREEHLEADFKQYENILNMIISHYPVFRNRFFYEKALFALSFPDINMLVTTMKEWGKERLSPEWFLKFLSLGAELGNIEGIEVYLRKLLLTIRQSRPKGTTKEDYDSLWLEGITLIDLMVFERGKPFNQPKESNLTLNLPSMIEPSIAPVNVFQGATSYQEPEPKGQKVSSDDNNNNLEYYSRRLDDLKASYCDPREEPLLNKASACQQVRQNSTVENKRAFDHEITAYHSDFLNKERLTGFQTLRYLEETGLLQHCGFISLYDKQLAYAARCLAPENSFLAFSAFNRVGMKEDTDYEMFFSQKMIYGIPQKQIDDLSERYIREIHWLIDNAKVYLNKAFNNLYKKLLCDLLEALSRLAFKASSRIHQAMFDLLMDLYRCPIERISIITQAQNYTKRLFESMSSSIICKNLEKILLIDFPQNDNESHFWINPFVYITLKQTDTNDVQKSKTISSSLDIWLERLDSDNEWRRRTALTILLIIYDWGILNKRQRSLFVKKLFSKVGLNGLPIQTDFYPWVFIKITQELKDSKSVEKNLLKYYNEYAFCLNDSDPSNQAFSFELTCYSLLINMSVTRGDTRVKINASSHDVWTIFSHIRSSLSQFMQHENASKNPFFARESIIHNKLLFLDRIIAEIVLPKTKDKKKRLQIMHFLQKSESFYPFPSSQSALLLPEDSFPDDLLRDFIAAISSSDRDRYNLYSWAILNAYIRAADKSGPEVPSGVFSALLNAVGMKTDDTFRLTCQNMTVILDYYEMIQQEQDLLLYYLDRLKEETLFSCENSRFPYESRYDYRIAAGGLAARVYKLYKDRGDTIPEALVGWEKISHSSDEFPSLRNKWDGVISYTE